MPYRIVEAATLAPGIRRFSVEAPHVVRHAGPGQFVIVRTLATSERIPLTIARADSQTGIVTIIVQAVGASTHELCAREAGESIADMAGPLGHATTTERVGHVVLVGGGVGTAVMFPQAPAWKAAGNRVSAVFGARSKQLLILEDELAAICDAVYPCTDDGSYGFAGFVTQKLADLIAAGPVDFVLCAGPVPMMRAVAEVTRPHGIRTVASLNPIMVDGTGMCGGCRVRVGGETRFACVEGPEFDAHRVDFRELMDRLTAYRQFEAAACQK